MGAPILTPDQAQRMRRAVADDLYFALDAFVRAWDGLDEPFKPQMPHLVAAAKRALAKARGEQ